RGQAEWPERQSVFHVSLTTWRLGGRPPNQIVAQSCLAVEEGANDFVQTLDAPLRCWPRCFVPARLAASLTRSRHHPAKPQIPGCETVTSLLLIRRGARPGSLGPGRPQADGCNRGLSVTGRIRVAAVRGFARQRVGRQEPTDVRSR